MKVLTLYILRYLFKFDSICNRYQESTIEAHHHYCQAWFSAICDKEKTDLKFPIQCANFSGIKCHCLVKVSLGLGKKCGVASSKPLFNSRLSTWRPWVLTLQLRALPLKDSQRTRSGDSLRLGKKRRPWVLPWSPWVLPQSLSNPLSPTMNFVSQKSAALCPSIPKGSPSAKRRSSSQWVRRGPKDARGVRQVQHDHIQDPKDTCSSTKNAQ